MPDPEFGGASKTERNTDTLHADLITDYESALGYLYGRINYEKTGHAPYTANHYRLDRMRQLLDRLGNPHKKSPIIHVAGTKGKGTVCHILANCLNECGYRTGLYTSPHLTRLEERFQVAGRCASESEFVEIARQVQFAAEQLEAENLGRPTFFELTTAMAMLHFEKCQVDCVVLEVGLGGRLDSTNVCQPVVSVITSISLDHQRQLGSTIAEIASEKAGIIKASTPAITTARDPEARVVIERIADERQAPLQMIGRDFDAAWEPITTSTCDLSEKRATSNITFQAGQKQIRVATRLLGSHQADNVAAALAVIELLRMQGWNLPADSVGSGVAKSQPPARLQIIAGTGGGRAPCPVQILDTAHNAASMAAGLAAIGQHFPDTRICAVFASSRDKDYRAMLSQLLVAADKLVLTAFHKNPRAVPREELEKTAQELSAEMRSLKRRIAQVESVEQPIAAWHRAVGHAQNSETPTLVFATGSFFLAAELLPELCDEST